MAIQVRPLFYQLVLERYGKQQQVATAMGVSYATVRKVWAGERGPGPEFISGALSALPGLRFEELFAVVPDKPERPRGGVTARAF